MPVQSAKKTIPDNTTQRYLPFSQIRENVIIMKDGSARKIMRCSTINFLLKSTEEQDSIIISYQRFLNTLDFPVQIIISSNKLDIDGYLKKLNGLAAEQKNELLQKQTYEYIEYLKKLVEIAQIMKKDFYIVVPYDLDEDKTVRDLSAWGMVSNFWWSINQWVDTSKTKSQIRIFEKLKKWLASRVNTVKTSLENIGISAVELNKDELVKLLMNYYNPSLDNSWLMKADIKNYDLL